MKNDSNITVSAEEILKIIEKNKLTQKEFAEKIQVDEITVSRWVTKERTCKGRYAAKVLEFGKPGERKNIIVNGKIHITIEFEEVEAFIKEDKEDKEDKEKESNNKIQLKDIHIITGNIISTT